MARKLNYPNQVQPDIEPDKLSLMVSDMAELQKLKPVKTDEEVEERLNFFFDWCSRKQLRPTVSLMCLCLGHPRQTLWTWQQRGDRRGVLVGRAKQVLESLTEQWMACGRINPVSGIFILKAAYGWRETLTIEALPRNDSLQPTMTPEEIRQALDAEMKRIPDYSGTHATLYDKRIAEEQAEQELVTVDYE